MKLALKKTVYWQKLVVLLAVMTLTVIGILAWFSWRTYSIQSENVLTTLAAESSHVDRTFTDTLDHTASIMRMIAMQIKPNPDDVEYVNGILSKYRANPNVMDVLSWTVFSWSNSKHLKTVDSSYGIMDKPFDMSIRTYIPLVMQYPNTMQVGKVVKGYTSSRVVIPAGLGVTDAKGHYVGAVTIGFDIDYLTTILKETVKTKGVEFALIDKELEVVLRSSENIPELGKKESALPEGDLRSLFAQVNFAGQDSKNYSDVHIFSDGNSFYFYKLTKYPYILYLKYDKKFLRQDLWKALTSRLIEVSLIALAAILLIIFIYRHEIRLRKEAEDAHHAVRQVNEHLEELVSNRTFQLENALKVKTEFLNNLSHEVRTPIQGVTAFSNSLIEHWKDWSDEQRFELALKTKDSAERLFSFVSDILDVSKIEAGKMTFTMKSNDMHIIARDLLRECEPLTLGKDVTLHYEASDNPLNVECDETRIAQVIRNLLANAIKFTPHGIVTLRTESRPIKYEDGRKTQGIYFSIHDEGIGIPEDEVHEIFNPFSQSTRTKTKAGGTGLGLTIAREIIQAHHGRIWADNNTDKGATVTFALPLKQPKRKKLPISDEGNTIMHTTVLMIDDEATCLEMMQFILHGTGFRLVTAQGGTAGLRYLIQHPREVDIILLDMMMPDMYGLDVLTEIMKNQSLKDIPVVIQSGVAEEKELKQAADLGAVSFIRKPYKKADLIHALEAIKLQTPSKRAG